MGRQDGGHVVMRFADVDDDRKVEANREVELALEALSLHGTRVEVVVIVEPDLPDGDESAGLEEPRQRVDRLIEGRTGRMARERVEARRCEHDARPAAR